MGTWLHRALQQFRFRVTHWTKFPKGDLISSLMNLSQRGFEPRHIVDVGANRGKWSRKARRVFPDADFTLVEPQIEMQPHLDRFCGQNPSAARWINAGVGAEMGELPLTLHPDTVSTTFVMSEAEARQAGLARRVVPIITLDHIAANVIQTIPDLVKIDAEGFEQEIIRGAGTLIGQTELFLLEAHFFGGNDNPCGLGQLIQMMVDLGYMPYDFTSFQKRPHDGAVGLCEIAFARQQGLLRSYHGWQSPLSRAA